jgi:competence ComEA-like helix-hairpin-helix protein
MLSRSLISAAILASCALAQEQQPQQLPDAPGKAALKKICASCHELESVVSSRRTRIGWERNVEEMVSRGAEGSDEDMSAVVEYLTTYFGKVNVNTAQPGALQKLLGLSAGEAQAIVAYREQNTKIKDFEELKKVPGVSAEKLQAKRGLIAFSL